MSSNGSQRRNNPFARTASQSPCPTVPNGRPKSMVLSSPLAGNTTSPHSRNQSTSNINAILQPSSIGSLRTRSSSKNIPPTSSGTFAPKFIEAKGSESIPERVNGIEGENDFSGKRYVWLKDPQSAFVKGWVVEELDHGQILVQCDDGSVSSTRIISTKIPLTIQ